MSQVQPIASDRDAADPWIKKVILTLDGGGVRGYGSLLMLRELMREVERLERDGSQVDEVHESSFCPYPPPKRPKSESRRRSISEDPSTRASESRRATDTIMRSASRKSRSFNFGVSRKPTVDETRTTNELKPKLSGYLPCHYFDYIGGTSTGGLSAIMLGRLRMSVEQCISRYPTMAHNIFSSPRTQFKGWPKAKHDAENLEREIEELVSIRIGKPMNNEDEKERKQFESPEDLCRTFVLSKKMDEDENSEELYIFRSYNNHKITTRLVPVNAGSASTQGIVEVGRATSAAPTFFKPKKIGDDFFSDGGILFNNPAEEAYKEILLKEDYYLNAINGVPIYLVLSIGTGGDDRNEPSDASATPTTTSQPVKRRRMRPFITTHLSKLGDKLSKEVTKGDTVDSNMRERSEDQKWEYFRWTGGKQMAKLKLDKWKPRRPRIGKNSTQEDIEGWAKEYMEQGTRQEEIRKIAKLLVDIRRRRVRHEDGDKWERFTYCGAFECFHCKDTKLFTRPLLMEHCRENHSEQFENDRRSLRTVPRWEPRIIGGPL